jgi:hypothetical protein
MTDEPAAGMTPPPDREPPAGPTVRDNLVGRFWALIVAPGQASAAIAARPAWVVGGIALIAVTAIFFGLILHIFEPEQIEFQLERATSDELANELNARLADAQSPTPSRRITMGVLYGCGVFLVGIVLPALIFHLFFRVSGGKGRATQSLGVVAWATLVTSTAKYVVMTPLVLSQETFRGIGTGLVLLVPDASPDSTLYLALNTLGDFFVWWQIALFAIGFAAAHAMPLRRSAVITIAVGALGGVIMLGFQVISMRLAG